MRKDLDVLKDEYLNSIKFALYKFGISQESVSINQYNELDIDSSLIDLSELNSSMNSNIQLKTKASLNREGIYFLLIDGFDAETEEIRSVFNSAQREANELINSITTEYLKELNAFHENKTLSERIPSFLMKNLEIGESLSNISEAKVKVIIGNSRGKDSPDVGEFDSVGYTLMGLTTGTIIPIARADEHHKGLDLLDYYLDKGLVPLDNYYPIFFNGEYAKPNDPEAIQAFKTWRKLGGKNIIINGEYGNNFQLTMDDYIRLEGNVEFSKGELAPIGDRLYKNLKKLSELVISFHNGNVKEKFVFTQAYKTYKIYSEEVNRWLSKDQDISQEIMKAESLGDVKKIEELFFGFGSFKNLLHNDIREAMKENNRSFKRREMESVFGDLDLAFHLLGSL